MRSSLRTLRASIRAEYARAMWNLTARTWLLLTTVLLSAPTLSSCALTCTEVGCTNRLTLRLEHSLALTGGPYLLEVVTPEQSLRCSVGPEPTGDRSCFGFRFADLQWDADQITILLTEPFGSGEPFESVDVSLSRDGVQLVDERFAVARGAAIEPNGPDCPPTCFDAQTGGAI